MDEKHIEGVSNCCEEHKGNVELKILLFVGLGGMSSKEKFWLYYQYDSYKAEYSE